jgi:hypothetical protein
MKAFWLGIAILLSSTSAFANTRICVSVQQRSWYKPAPPAQPQAAAQPQLPAQSPAPAPAPVLGPAEADPPAHGALSREEAWKRAAATASHPKQPPPKVQPSPHEIDPTLYLKRMLEYEITHEPGFAAVTERCQQRVAVELYQLESGWTVFARYSGTEREEKVDHAEVDEFDQLAQRIAFALLRNRAISHTITRENVLRADSETNLRTINGTGHLLFGMGTHARTANLPTAENPMQPAETQVRVFTPVSVHVGYRRKLRAWGLDAFTRLNLGMENTGIHRNELGGHVDYSGSVLLGLHFLHYLDATGINSFYFGGGAAFELAFLGAIRAVEDRSLDSRDNLLGGGLNVDFLVGYEFLRASSVHFFGQIEVNAPTYLLKTENQSGAVDTYMPGALAQIGIIF